MNKLVLSLIILWLVPSDPSSIGFQPPKQTLVRGFKVFGGLGPLILYLSWGALPVCGVWLAVTFGHAYFQYRYAFADTLSRPPQYEEISAVLLALDVVSFVAVAGFSSVGWWAIVPVGIAWWSLGRTAGALALNREMKQALSWVRDEYPTESPEWHAETTQQVVARRLAVLYE